MNESVDLIDGVDRRQRAEIARMLEAVARAHDQVDAALGVEKSAKSANTESDGRAEA